MSTRSQVMVHSSGLGWDEEPRLLYHHCDGYPEYMLPKIEEAFNFALPYGDNCRWKKGRAGKVASLLCAVDPAEFEPEERVFHDGLLVLHGDIEYFYDITITNKTGGSIAEKPFWVISVYEPNEGFWDAPNVCNMTKVKMLTLCG